MDEAEAAVAGFRGGGGGGVDAVSILLPSSSSSSSCGGDRRVVVPSGDTMRLSADADASSDPGSDVDASSDSALLLRVVLRARREYCFISFSSLLMKGDKVCGCARI